ncbi:hypothetical protein GCM10007979_31190 [Nocardioides albus]|nr:hypothetical protein GCM10007979_31190 [Nocardioides albus]
MGGLPESAPTEPRDHNAAYGPFAGIFDERSVTELQLPEIGDLCGRGGDQERSEARCFHTPWKNWAPDHMVSATATARQTWKA